MESNCQLLQEGSKMYLYLSAEAISADVKGKGKVIPLQARCGPEGW